MKLESLQLDKFKDNGLKREQMFHLNGGGTVTPAGQACGSNTVYPYTPIYFNYGYDVNREGLITYHDRTNYRNISAEECLQLQASYKLI